MLDTLNVAHAELAATESPRMPATACKSDVEQDKGPEVMVVQLGLSSQSMAVSTYRHVPGSGVNRACSGRQLQAVGWIVIFGLVASDNLRCPNPLS